MNKCITQAGEDQPVKYNFDILEDQVPHNHHDHYTLVYMVGNHNDEKVCGKCTDCTLRNFLC